MGSNSFLDTLVTFNGVQPTLKAQQIGSQKFYSVEGEFWTSAQRQGMNLHEISYRACFKPQLPSYFIGRFSNPDDVVYDPFAGRGTTLIEAASVDRQVILNDINPLSTYFTRPRLELPELDDVATRLDKISRVTRTKCPVDLSMFYEKKTLMEILALREYLDNVRNDGSEDSTDRWIRMVATNRLTGHSSGFFSVYTMPPNQAVSASRQIKINQKRNQSPEYRDTHALVLKKSKQLQSGLTEKQVQSLRRSSETAKYFNLDASETKSIRANTVQLTVTSPPFLDIVQYSDDNWLRGWFNNIDMDSVSAKITMARTLDQWNKKMSSVFSELFRITKPGGFVAFEVGEVRNGNIKLEEAVIPLGLNAGFELLGTLINTQSFTKTSNIWGISNNKVGTNSNRVVVFRK